MLDLFIAVKGCFSPKIALLKNSRFFNSKLKRGIFELPNRVDPGRESFKRGFSLVEMLMALLVASLLLAALAPVMTRRMQDSMTISVEGEIPGKITKIHEIEYDSVDCPGGTKAKIDEDGSQYCEGEFTVPQGYNGQMKVTVIGAGGGGGTASTAGYIEYTNVGTTNSFIVPALVNKLEATLISGGAGGGAGGQVLKAWEKLTGGVETWTVPNVTKNKYVNVKICGAGGGRGVSDSYGSTGGGGGAYINKAVLLYNDASIAAIVGGRGSDGSSGTPISAASYGGGGGGSSNYTGGSGADNCGGAGGNGDWLTTAGNLPTAGKGATDGGNNGNCSIATTIPGVGTGVGGSSGKFISVWSEHPETTICTSGGGGVLCAGGGAGGSWGAGGGGGGASAFGLNGQSFYILASGGGGGAGALAPGAGGGGKNGGNGGDTCTDGGACSQFSGGGGANCLNTSNCTAGNNGGNNWNGSSYITGNTASSVVSEFPNNCGGGQNGALKIIYLDYGPGGGGGGGGQLIPIQSLNVVSNETLNIKIGNGAIGGTKGYIDASGVVIDPTVGSGSNGTYEQWDALVSRIYRKDNIILTTSPYHQWSCTYGGSYTGVTNEPGYGCAGNITTGADVPEVPVTVAGFSNISGYNAGNSEGTGVPSLGNNTYPNGSTGGAGGIVTTPWFTCTPGKGGTASNPEGGNAQGYGCGGGGGYGLSNGGSGSGGYARISWNKYWDAALNSGKGGYKYADAGTAGGGASGNIVTYTIDVKSGERIKFRIGKGGDGASVDNNILNPAKKGGDTVFGINKTSIKVEAGGGNGGGSPTITGVHPDTTITNGVGGTLNTLYKYKDKTITTRCNNTTTISNCYIPSIQGNPGISNKGGSGATLERNDKLLRTNVNNSGGKGGTTGDNAKGTNAIGYGSGGGGAGILDIGANPATSTYNPNTGGNGTNGKIILEWWE